MATIFAIADNGAKLSMERVGKVDHGCDGNDVYFHITSDIDVTAAEVGQAVRAGDSTCLVSVYELAGSQVEFVAVLHLRLDN